MGYTDTMRKYLLILTLLIASSASAQDGTTIFDMFRNLGATECESLIREGDTYMVGSIRAANLEEWDAAFYHQENAFHTFLKAHFGWCDEEPENKKLAKQRLDENQAYHNKLTCNYHVIQAHHASVRSQLALEHLGSASVALKHAKDSLSAVDEAIKFCAYDEERADGLIETRVGGEKAIVLIEYQMLLEEADGTAVTIFK